VVCRDRSDLYAEGIRQGAPQAGQVVDRFYLIHNLRQAVEAFLANQRPALQAAAVGTALEPQACAAEGGSCTAAPTRPLGRDL
jgi:transposase